MRRVHVFVPSIIFASAIVWLVPTEVMAQHAAMHRGASSTDSIGAPSPSIRRSISPAPSHTASPRLGVRVSVPVTPRTARPRPGAGRPGSGSIQTRHVHVNVIPFDNSGETDFGDVPGLGFDFPHLAAINGRMHFGRERFAAGFPFGFGGFFLPTEPVIIEQAQPAAPESEDDVAADVTEAEPIRDSRAHRRASAQTSLAQNESRTAAPSQAEPDPAEYVFVRRDGSLLFAVAYSWQNGMLRYITRDGMRHTVPSEALDLSATEQFNEQRGLTFHFPV